MSKNSNYLHVLQESHKKCWILKGKKELHYRAIHAPGHIKPAMTMSSHTSVYFLEGGKSLFNPEAKRISNVPTCEHKSCACKCVCHICPWAHLRSKESPSFCLLFSILPLLGPTSQGPQESMSLRHPSSPTKPHLSTGKNLKNAFRGSSNRQLR